LVFAGEIIGWRCFKHCTGVAAAACSATWGRQPHAACDAAAQ